MHRDLVMPIDESTVRALRVGDTFHLTGTLYTARDQAHLLMLERHDSGSNMLFDPSPMALFHCGPVMAKKHDGWKVIAAGPTTSMRMNAFEDRFLEIFRPRILIGKGGMGDRTSAALHSVGAVYTHYTGGAGALGAQQIESVLGVYWLEELGMAEAVWLLKAKRFGPLLVTMDAEGGTLYKDLDRTIDKNVKAIFDRIDST